LLLRGSSPSFASHFPPRRCPSPSPDGF
jgi:hypothetical protein